MVHNQDCCVFVYEFQFLIDFVQISTAYLLFLVTNCVLFSDWQIVMRSLPIDQCRTNLEFICRVSLQFILWEITGSSIMNPKYIIRFSYKIFSNSQIAFDQVQINSTTNTPIMPFFDEVSLSFQMPIKFKNFKKLAFPVNSWHSNQNV